MRAIKFLFTFFLTTNLFFQVNGQDLNDSVFLKKIYNESLSNGRAYADLHHLCKKIGCRVSGSKQAQMAVDWTNSLMRSYGFDTVYLQQITVPNWKRGKKEKLYVRMMNPSKEVKDPYINLKLI
jgi:carboxypeptidase Q